MTKWTKIENLGGGRAAVQKFRVCRHQSGSQQALLFIPEKFVISDRADWFFAGDTAAVKQHDQGDYSVFRNNKNAKSKALSIPSVLGHRIPFGTTPVDVTHEDGMIVIDFSQLPAAQEAAE